MKLTTTFNLLRENNACESGYKKLAKHLGDNYGRDEPINLLTILESNGVADCLWCLRATKESIEDLPKKLAYEFTDYAIRVVLKIHKDPDFKIWSENWLDGSDRSKASAARAAAGVVAAADAVEAAVWAAGAVAESEEHFAMIIRKYLS